MEMEKKEITTVDGNSRKRDLPFDLMSEILSRLPAKSVVRFESVSRSWYQLITRLINEPWFIKTHLRRSLEANPDTYMIEMRQSEEKRLHSFTAGKFYSGHPKDDHDQENNYNYGFEVTEYTHPWNIENNRGDGLKAITRVIGSCNGLLCFYKYCSNKKRNFYFLYNPVTRDLRKLPPFHPTKNKPVAIAFGYDCVSNDYKVLGYDLRLRTSMLYSLKTDAWEDIPNLPTSRLLGLYPAILANNTLYWFKGWCWGTTVLITWIIVCFDLSTRRYYRILHPDQHKARQSELTISRGQLYIVTRNLDIWLLNKHDDDDDDKQNSTWTRIFRHHLGQLNKYLDITSGQSFESFDRVCCLKDGHNIILAFFVSGDLQNFLICCDLETNEAREIEATNLDHLKSVFDMHPWVGSFVPLH